MPMGSPASPVIADIVMEELLTNFEKDSDNKQRLLTKYVDDVFAIIKTETMDKMLNTLNNYNKTIKFTIEIERDGQLPYLDTLIIRKNNIITFDWYKKPTASGRLINFNSKHEKKAILNTASNFIRRVLSISDQIYHTKNITIIKEILGRNEFPRGMINKLIRNYYVRNNKGEKIKS
ncbi:uncharacterized protein LOC118753307 [Rhagoletis pomonella]|uniref:uncharacterized protein LOC118753307 n=1 Tax=Rhagoletis pomonella TaxID=28610 RepID=UPI001783A8EF|nr:uncharacterized protein LOC118753307 [Rhagoletis pomonella]